MVTNRKLHLRSKIQTGSIGPAKRLYEYNSARMTRVPPNLDDAPYWWKRAEQSRAIAERLSDPQAKGELRIVAETYERLAKNAEARARQQDVREDDPRR